MRVFKFKSILYVVVIALPIIIIIYIFLMLPIHSIQSIGHIVGFDGPYPIIELQTRSGYLIHFTDQEESTKSYIALNRVQVNDTIDVVYNEYNPSFARVGIIKGGTILAGTFFYLILIITMIALDLFIINRFIKMRRSIR